MTSEDKNIDVVIMWVDGSDRSWIAQKNTWLGDNLSQIDLDAEVNRYRDWENLQYIFRGVETFMPWVRKVHLVTNGQKPDWLNEGYEKVNLVKHEDFIPKEYLPLFSSTAIEVNLHRIKDLSDKFIYFNDDMFVLKPQQPTDWFKNGLPRDQFGLIRTVNGNYSENFWHINFNVMGVINRNTDKIALTKKHFVKYFSPKNGLISLIMSILHYPPKLFPGFIISHQPNPFLKKTFFDMWEREPDVLDSTSRHRFRDAMDVNQYLMKAWQLVNGNFYPKNWHSKNCNFLFTDDTYANVESVLRSNKYDLFCIGDEMKNNFNEAKMVVNAELDAILPNKSSFEL